MNSFIIKWQYVLVPIAILIITQLSKYTIHGFQSKDWNIVKNIGAYGRIPSSHTAYIIALLTLIGHSHGFSSPLFGLTTIFAAITIRDAIGLRQFLGGHSHIINQIVRTLPAKTQKQFPIEQEIIGHRKIEVLVGGLIGFLLASGFTLLIA